MGGRAPQGSTILTTAQVELGHAEKRELGHKRQDVGRGS